MAIWIVVSPMVIFERVELRLSFFGTLAAPECSFGIIISQADYFFAPPLFLDLPKLNARLSWIDSIGQRNRLATQIIGITCLTVVHLFTIDSILAKEPVFVCGKQRQTSFAQR